MNPALNADLDPTGRPLRLPDCPGFQDFKLGYVSIVSHCLFDKVRGEGFRGRSTKCPRARSVRGRLSRWQGPASAAAAASAALSTRRSRRRPCRKLREQTTRSTWPRIIALISTVNKQKSAGDFGRTYGTVRDVSSLLIFSGARKLWLEPKRNVFIHKKGGEKLLDIVGNFRSAPTEGSVIACGRTAAQTTVQARQDPI